MNYYTKAIKEVLVLCVDEWKKIFTDGGVILLLFGATLIYPLIYSFTYQTEVLTETPIAIINHNNTKLSRDLIRMIDATPEVEVAIDAQNMQEAERLFYKGDVAGIVLIPKDFTEAIYKKETSSIAVYSDASYMLLYKQVYKAVSMTSQILGKQIEVKQKLLSGVPTDIAVKQVNPVQLRSEALYNPHSGYGSYVMPAILVLILQQTLLLGIGMRGGTDRELGAQHYLIPLNASKKGVLRIFAAKTLAYFLLYIPISFYLLVLIMRWFGLPQAGNTFDILMVAIPLILSCIMLGLLFTSFFRNRENSMIFLLFTSVPLVFLSGFSWPVEAFPFGFEAISHLFPSTAGIKAFINISVMGGDIHTAKNEILELWLMFFVLFVVNWILIEKKIRKMRKVTA